MTVEFITATGAGTWVVPSGVTSVDVEVIGGGGGGGTEIAATGGGGGAYSKTVGVSVTPSSTCYVSVGIGGVVTTSGGDTWFNKSSNAAPASTSDGALAKGGTQLNLTGDNWSPGGAAASGVGTTKYSGGRGACGTYAGGGGGAGSQYGNGLDGGRGSVSSCGGGGSAGGGSVGLDGDGTNGGAGGNNNNSTDGGAVSTAGAARNGFVGAGGGGDDGTAAGTSGGAGAPGREYYDGSGYAGAGGGGGGEYSGGTAGGHGGLYGGGSGSRRSAPGAQGVIVLTYSTAPAPTIGTEPTAQSVTAPAAATFTASVSGTYTGLRWQRQAAGAGGWSDVSGATSTSLTTGATSVTGGSWNNTDRVRLAVDWSGGVVYSTDVALTVVAGGTAPAITVQPSNQSVTVGSTAIFGVTASGSGTLTYQWQRQPSGGGGYTDISGATSSSYTTPATTITGGSANNGDTYRCVVTGDTAPPATSSVATLTVLQPVATTVSVTLTTDGTTPAASLSGLKWAFYDQVTPDLFTAAPVVKGAAETTDGSGVFSASITGTALRVGDTGYLIVTNSDGTTTQGAALKAFAAPVVVA